MSSFVAIVEWARQETTITLIIALIIREHAADENGITR
jgi:hypothetical protein